MDENNISNGQEDDRQRKGKQAEKGPLNQGVRNKNRSKETEMKNLEHQKT